MEAITHAPDRTHDRPAPDVKSAEPPLEDAFDEFRRTFETFKEGNDRKLEELQRKSTADVVTVEKVERISKALDEQKRAMDQYVLRGRRPPLSTEGPRSAVNLEHKAAFDAYVRGGDEDGLRRIEQKSLAVGSDGGYVVPEETEREIGRRLASLSPIRGISGIRQVSGNVYKKPFAITGAATGWVGETAARPETTAPTLAELAFPAMELYAMPAATSTLLDDAAVNIDEWLADEVETAFATQEGTAFVSGDGTNKPKGFLAYTKVAEASWSWTNIGYIVTGVSGGFAASNPSDNLIDLVYALKSGYRQNAHLGDEPEDARGGAEAQGRRRQLHLAAGGGRRWHGEPDELPRSRIRGHAGHRRQQPLDRLRRLPPRLPGGRPRRHPRAPRSVFRQALRALLHDQARRRRHPGLRRDQAPQVRHDLTPPSSPGLVPKGRLR